MNQVKHMQTLEELQAIRETGMESVYKRMIHAMEHEHIERNIAKRLERETLDHGYFDSVESSEEKKTYRLIKIVGTVLAILIILFVLFH